MYKVLIAEDEKPLREKMTKNIDWSGEGYCIYQAKDGEEALKVLIQEEIHILVTDIQMPGLSGLELVAKAREFLPNLWIIVVSGNGDFERAPLVHLGITDFLLKPFRSQRLLETVNRTREAMECNRV